MKLNEILHLKISDKVSSEIARGSSIRDDDEEFHFMRYHFKVGEIYRAIKTGKIKATPEEVDITQWATKGLGLRLNDKEHRPHSLFVGINYDHLDKIEEKRLNKPGIIVNTKFGGLVIDGNHRVAKKFMNGETKMMFYVLEEKPLKKLLLLSS